MYSFPFDQHPDLIDEQTALFWFRRDLRLDDNAGLYHALKAGIPVLGIFIFDTAILDKLEDVADRRVTFIHQSLLILKERLEEHGSSLLILHGDPIDIFKNIPACRAVYTNHDYEPYARERDQKVKEILQGKGISFHTYKDQVVFEKDEVLKTDGSPYTVFTPYSRQWKSLLNDFYLTPYPVNTYCNNLKKVTPLPVPEIKDLGFTPVTFDFPVRKVSVKTIEQYHARRNFPAVAGTTRLGVHLRFGTISIRMVAAMALKKSEQWLNELIWRDFYAMILWHFPQVEHHAFKPAYDRIKWRNNADEFRAWCEGKTGYPLVDAGMRELNETGFMHNRVRMVAASFLCKHLLIDWRWGEAYFARKLLDYDLASNNGGWQWSAGSGNDSAPYFRIFNPDLQTKKFDPDLAYIKKWLPEFGSTAYPPPIVEHKLARERALAEYQKAVR